MHVCATFGDRETGAWMCTILPMPWPRQSESVLGRLAQELGESRGKVEEGRIGQGAGGGPVGRTAQGGNPEPESST